MAANFDVIHIILGTSLRLITEIKKCSKARIVYNLCDSIWLPSFAETYPNLDRMLEVVDAITCDNRIGLDYASRFNRSVFPWRSPSQVEYFDLKRGQIQKNEQEIVIGWVGSPSTTFNLYAIWEALEIVFTRHSNIHLRILGVGRECPRLPQFERVQFSILPYYTQAEMIEEVLRMNIGIFPMFNVENSRVRGVLKALIYMSGEAALIASPVGTVPDVIENGVNGLLAESKDQWITVLDELILDGAKRYRLATAALDTVRKQFSMHQAFDDLRAALDV